MIFDDIDIPHSPISTVQATATRLETSVPLTNCDKNIPTYAITGLFSIIMITVLLIILIKAPFPVLRGLRKGPLQQWHCVTLVSVPVILAKIRVKKVKVESYQTKK